MRNQERMIELQKKVHRRIYVRDITFLTARSPFYDFLLLSSSTLTPFPSDAMGGILCDAMGDAMGGILCDDIMSKRSKVCKSSTI